MAAVIDNDLTALNNDRKAPQLDGKRIRFGYEKPAIAGPGRPPLPKAQKERQRLLREMIQELTPKAIEVVEEILNSKRALDKDRLRAAEILVMNSIPRQEEMIDDPVGDNPFVGLPPAQLQTLIKLITAGGDMPQGSGSLGH